MGAATVPRSHRRARTSSRCSRRVPRCRATRLIASPPTGTTSRGWSSRSSHSSQKRQSSSSRGLGGRSPRPLGCLPGIAARDGRAVEGRVEPLLVHVEPAAKRLARAAAPRAALDTLDDPRRLADDHRALARAAFEDGQRLERIARLDAGAADAVVPLQRGERPVAGASPGDPGSLAASSSSCSQRRGAGACSSASGP